MKELVSTKLIIGASARISLLVILIFFASLTATAQDNYFWVGEGLDPLWTDADNWSLISGGTGGAGVPTAVDDATFDANSFVGTGEQVVLTGGVFQVANIDWTGAGNFPSFQITPTGTLSVSGNFTLTAGMEFVNSGQLQLSSDAGNTNNVTFANQEVGNVRFENPTFDDLAPVYTTWVLQDALDGSFIVVADGADLTTQFGGTSISASDGMSFTSFATGDLGFSLIDLQNNWINQSGDVALDNAIIQMNITGTGGGSYSFDGGGDSYGTVFFGGAHDFFVSGSNTYNQLLITDQANVQFTYFETQTINQLSAVGTDTQPIGLRSDDPLSGSAILDLGVSGTTGVLFAEIEGIEIQGENTPYPAISSVDVGSNSGWAFIDFTYQEDFEANDGGWTEGGSSPSWQYGNAGSNIPPSDGLWATNRSGEFDPEEASYIQSPVIDLTGITSPTISLNLWLDMLVDEFQSSFLELTIRDIAYLEYSTDGTNYQLAGTGMEPNWYNLDGSDPGIVIISNPVAHDGWIGTNTDWENFSLSIPAVANESNVTFRLNFITDATVPGGFEGVAIDDFFVYDLDGGGEPMFDLESDSLALVAMYDAMDGPNWSVNWETDPIGLWDGVSLNNGRVEQLNLEFSNLSGPLPWNIGDLTFLRQFTLGGNSITGPLPSEIGNMDSLRAIDLNNNLITGLIPTNISNLSKLIQLNLSNNQLSGVVPEDVTLLTDLIEFNINNNESLCEPASGAYISWTSGLSLYLNANTCQGVLLADSLALEALYLSTGGGSWFNQQNWLQPGQNVASWEGVAISGGRVTEIALFANGLTGPLPTEVGDLDALTKLEIYDNNLTGAIPPEVGNLVNLKVLDLDFNQFSGTVPTELSNLTSLEDLWLRDNMLTGTIPTGLFATVSTLKKVLLGGNSWDASNFQDIVADLALSTGLIEIDFGSANIGGSIPATIDQFNSLQSLDLPDNAISGPIPAEIGNLSSLGQLGLANNQLTGIVPLSITTLPNLTDVDFSGNASLCEPADGAYATWVTGLEFYDNTNICTVVEPILEADSLALVALYNSTDGPNWTNQTGWEFIDGVGSPEPVSTWFGVMVSGDRVSEINLGANSLSGPLPMEIGDLTALTKLECGNNALSGSIPVEIGLATDLTLIALNSNQLTGAIPAEIGDLSNLEVLAFGGNLLDGQIPTSVGNLASMASFDLQGNQISGDIPAELGQLADLFLLNLSFNSLTGMIPPELGDLSLLQFLFLDNNFIEGTVPEEFAMLAALSDFDIANNELLCEPMSIPYSDWVAGLSNYDNSGTCLNTCATAEEIISAGSYIASGTPYYYTYTAGPADEVILISSAGSSVDTDLNVYDACGGNLIAESDDIDFGGGVFQSEVSFVLAANQTIFIEWLDTWEAAGFEWIFDVQLAPPIFPVANISLGSVSGTQAVVRWDDTLNDFPIDYVIEQSVNSNSAFTELDRITIAEAIDPGRYIYLNEGLNSVDEFFYRVYADDGVNVSDFSDTVSIILTPSDFELNTDLYFQILPQTVKGLGWGDYDGDGDEDLFAGQFSLGADRSYFFENNNDETFTEKAQALGFDYVSGDNVRGAAWADFNNDGLLDLLATNLTSDNTGNPSSIYLNNGIGGFTEVPLDIDNSFFAIALGDFNGDNLIDFAITAVPAAGGNALRIFTSDLATFLSGEPNHYQTTDIPLLGASWSIASGDVEDDGDIDLFVSALSDVDHQLFLNDGTGTFTETEKAGLTDLGARSRGSQFVDLNNDGFEDIYISTAGTPGVNKYYTNDGAGNFLDTDLGIAGARSNAIEDFDNDGDLDIFAAEGVNAIGYFENSGGIFSDATSQDFSITGLEFPAGASPADYNNDGFMDFALAGDAVNLYTNRRVADGSNNYLKVKLDSRKVNFTGIGAKITVTGTPAGTMTRVLKGQTGPESHTSLIKHFGLGSSATADVTVEWPDGRVSNFPAVAANQTLEVNDYVDRDLDSLIMVNYYIETSGNNWTSSTDWFSGTLDTWQGVTVVGDRITAIDLSNNNLVDSIRTDSAQLNLMTSFNVAGNELIALPPLQNFASLNSIDAINNRLLFNDIQPILDGGYVGDFFYSPQKPFGTAQNVTVSTGGSVTLASGVTFSGPETYQWLFNGDTIPGAVNATYSITNATIAVEGAYSLKVENTNVPGLTLESEPINVTFQTNSPVAIAALTALYNATDGENWDANIGWLVDENLANWFGVTTNAEGQVTGLDLANNGLIGVVPNGFVNLVNLVVLDLSDNDLTGLPDLSDITGLSNVDISGNKLYFDDIIPNAEITGIDYSPQQTFGIADTITVDVVSPAELSTQVSFNTNSNIYRWTRDGVTAFDTTTQVLTISSTVLADSGQYRLEIRNPNATGLVLTSLPIKLNIFPNWPTNIADSLALVSMYNSLGGASWPNRANWLADTMETWQGITVVEGNVTAIDLADNNLAGNMATLPADAFRFVQSMDLSGNAITNMPASFPEMGSLQTLDLANNQLETIPDSTGLASLLSLDVVNNSLFFNELEAFVGLGTFTYIPQDSLSTNLTQIAQEGQPVAYSYPVNGTNPIYTWRKDGVVIASETDETLSFPAFTVNDNGVYTLTVTSNIVTGLSFSTGEISLTMANSTADSLALVNMYNNLGGENWTNQTGWLTEPVTNWFGVTASDGKVRSIDLSANNLTGSFPAVSGFAFSELETLDLSDNDVIALIDFSVLTNLTSVEVDGNRLEFAELELQSDLGLLSYSPQQLLLDTLRVIQELGTSFTISREISGQNNVYSWTKSGEIFAEVTSEISFSEAVFADDAVYQMTATNSSIPGLTLETAPITVLIASLERDIATLRELFDALGGVNWNVAANWREDPINQPEVILNETGTRVIGLNLSGVGLVGDVPESLTSMTELVSIDLSDNMITSVPALLDMPNLEFLDISGNNLQYESIQDNLDPQAVDFDNQAPITPDTLIILPQGSELVLEARLRGENLAYQWFKEDELLPGANSEAFPIDSLNYEDMGFYYCLITNNEVLSINPGFSLRTGNIQVLATANIAGSLRNLDNVSVPLGEVTLYEIAPIGTPYTPTDTLIVTDSDYLFQDVILDDYIIRAVPEDTVYIPTYHTSGVTFDLGDTIALRQDVEEINVLFQEDPPELLPDPANINEVFGTMELEEDDFPELFGEGPAGGRTLARRRVRRSGIALSRLRSVIRTEDDIFELIAFEVTNEEGEFDFSNLPDGTYRINFDFPGVPTDPNSFVQFELGESGALEQSLVTLTADVRREGIVVSLIEETSIRRNLNYKVNIYPNPAQALLKVELSSTIGAVGKVKMQLMDINGRLVLDSNEVQNGDESLTVDVSRLRAGMYLLLILNDQSEMIYSGRIMKR